VIKCWVASAARRALGCVVVEEGLVVVAEVAEVEMEVERWLGVFRVLVEVEGAAVGCS